MKKKIRARVPFNTGQRIHRPSKGKGSYNRKDMKQVNEETSGTMCNVCGNHVEQHESAIELGILTGELQSKGASRFVYRDKHIGCSPSRAQRIIHPRYPRVIDDREQFDIRLWSEEDRAKWTKVYTEAWVRLQEKHNPSWKGGEA